MEILCQFRNVNSLKFPCVLQHLHKITRTKPHMVLDAPYEHLSKEPVVGTLDSLYPEHPSSFDHSFNCIFFFVPAMCQRLS